MNLTKEKKYLTTNYFNLLLFTLIFLIFNCTKFDNPVLPALEDSNSNISAQFSDSLSHRTNFLKYLYETGLKNRYYWHDEITEIDYKDAKYYLENEYTTTLDAAKGFLNDSKYPLDKWSSVVQTGDYSARASSSNPNIFNQQSNFRSLGYLYGFRYGWFQYNDELYIKVVFVVPDSPAERAGLERGDRILKFTPQNSSSIACCRLASDNLGQEIDITKITNLTRFENLLSLSGAAKFTTMKNTSAVAEISMERELLEDSFFLNINKNETEMSSRFAPTLITISNSSGSSSKKIGYSIYIGFDANSVKDLLNMFNYWYQNGVKEVVLDLRYNSGGRVDVAQLIASMLIDRKDELFVKLDYRSINSQANDQMINFEEINSTYLRNHFGISPNEFPENNLNNLGISKIYFLVGNNSASASELLIKGLQPYLDEVVVIGARTHGKGYGQLFESDPTGLYQLALINFKYFNASGEGVGFSGIEPNDGFAINDDVNQSWGENENLLGLAIDDIKREFNNEQSLMWRRLSTFSRIRSLEGKNPQVEELSPEKPDNQYYLFSPSPEKKEIEFPYDNKFN